MRNPNQNRPKGGPAHVQAGTPSRCARQSPTTAKPARARSVMICGVTTTPDTSTSGSNDPVSSYGALLIKEDPTGRVTEIMERVCDLSQADYDRFSSAYKTMFDLLVANMFTYVRQSARDLFQVVTDASDAMRDGEISTTHPDGWVMWATKLRTAILSVCSSIHHHQDQSYIEVVRKFGKESAEHNAMRAAFAEIYDNCFGYRYLYKLRNTMVHYTMLAASMHAEARIYKGKKIALVEMNMDRSALLEQNGHLNKKLREELTSLPEDPSIYQMVGEALPHLRDTNRRILEILYPEIDSICQDVREFDSLFDGREGVRALIHQQSPELRAPFTTGYSAWANEILTLANSRLSAEADGGSTGATGAVSRPTAEGI